MTNTRAPLLLHVYSTFAVGGPQVRFATIANRLGSEFRHAVIAMDGRVDARDLLEPGLDVAFPDIEITKGESLGNLRRFRTVLRLMKPDLLVTSNWGSIEWSMARMGLPLRHLHAEDGFGPEERERQLRRRVIARRVLLRGARVVLPSRVLWRIARDVWRLPEAQLRLVPNGVNLARFSKRRREGGSDGDIVIGTVAALRPEKNLARLIRAFSHLPTTPPARLVIVGDGPERPVLEELAVTEGVATRVHFTGHAPDPSRLFEGFDLFALSSDTEQMPLSVLEAMAAGLPVAATDVGDVREMVSADNRAHVVAREDAALTGAIHALLADAQLRRRIGAANRARTETLYAEESMVAAWRELFLASG